MGAPSCATCLFYYPGTSKGFPEVAGMCRRYAPQGMAAKGNAGWQIFPPMQPDHWCGDYRPDPDHSAPAKAAAA